MEVSASGDPAETNVFIGGNTIANSYFNGINVGGPGQNVVLQGNTITNVTGSAITLNSNATGNFVLIGNTFSGVPSGQPAVLNQSNASQCTLATAVNATSYNSFSGIANGTSSENMPYVKNIVNGDYTVYNAINLNGATTFIARAASGGLGGTINIHLDSATGTVIGTATVPVTGGWQNWTDVSCSLTGASGVHAIYLVYTGGTGNSLFNLEWFAFSGQSPYGITEAATYNSISSGLGLETCSEGGQNLKNLTNGAYSVYNAVDLDGFTGFSARVASGATGGTIQVRLDSPTGTVIGTASVASTGGWQTWTTDTCSVSGASGFHNVYLVYTGGSGNTLFNVEWFAFNY